MINLLCIGNSFSQDVTKYLYDIAAADGVNIKVVNLYIGGCSLKTHCENIENDASLYEYEKNGTSMNCMVSIKSALVEESWDYITLQQASHDSGILDTYYPYFKQLSDYVKTYAPNAKQLIHQTWAYGVNSTHPAFSLYDCNQVKMYNALKNAYDCVAKENGLDIIPTGELVQRLRETNRFDLPNSEVKLVRDGFHLSFDYGRYAAAALFYAIILKGNILENKFIPTNCNEEIIKLIKENVCLLS